MAILHYHPHRPSSTGRRSLGASASLVVSAVSGAGLLVETVTDPRHLPLALATATVTGALIWALRRQQAADREREQQHRQAIETAMRAVHEDARREGRVEGIAEGYVLGLSRRLMD